MSTGLQMYPSASIFIAVAISLFSTLAVTKMNGICTVVGCSSVAPDIAVANFRGVKGASSSQFDWNISWPMSGINYTLYRSSDNITYAPVHTIVATNDSSINFSYTDLAVPSSGNKYYYYLTASKTDCAPVETFVIIPA